MQGTWRARVALVGAGVLSATVTAVVIARDPYLAIAAPSVWGALGDAAVGLALIGTGSVLLSAGGTRRTGGLLALAGFGWMAQEWNSQSAGSSIVFTAGLALVGMVAPLVLHATLVYVPGPSGTHATRTVVAIGYLLPLATIGVGSALVTDPTAQGCGSCARNLLLVVDAPEVALALRGMAAWAIPAWCAVAVALLVARVLRATPARRRLSFPSSLAAAAYLVVVGVVNLSRAAHEDRDPVTGIFGISLWVVEGILLTALAAGFLTSPLSGRRARVALAGLAVRQQGPENPALGLQRTLASLVGDRSLRLSFPLDTGTVDREGLPVVPTPGAEVTTLNMAGQPWAEIEHQPGALADGQHLDDIVAAARLTVDHERFEAQALAQLRLLRESRTRVVSAADLERQRLERDLHDGAQQRLVALAMAIQLARLSADGGGIDHSVLEACAGHVRGAIDDLRTVAHGIFPSVLAEEGLASAFAQLAETAPVRILIHSPIGRLPSDVESAAYFVGARAIDRFVAEDGVIELSRTTTCLRLRVTVDRAPDLAITDLEDRAGAVDGTLVLVPAPDDRPQLVLELPCAS